MTQSNSSHSLTDSQWQQVKEWVLDGKKQLEIKKLVLDTFQIEITQGGISLSKHYKAAKKELTAQIAESARAELESNLPLVVKMTTKNMQSVVNERDKSEAALTVLIGKNKGPESREYAAISKVIESLDKSFCGYLDRFNTLLENTTGMSASPVQDEDAKQETKDFISDLRKQRELAENINKN